MSEARFPNGFASIFLVLAKLMRKLVSSCVDSKACLVFYDNTGISCVVFGVGSLFFISVEEQHMLMNVHETFCTLFTSSVIRVICTFHMSVLYN